jgi:hypothetical protein
VKVKNLGNVDAYGVPIVIEIISSSIPEIKEGWEYYFPD